MTIEMSPDELEATIKSSKETDSYDYRNPDDDDDYISAYLYETTDHRFFRLVHSSGMNSKFAGAGNLGEWLVGQEVSNWNKF